MGPQHIDPKLQDLKIPPLHLVPHHSVPGDWDFRRLTDWSEPSWELTTDWYISSPSSLRLKNGRATTEDILAICKWAGTGDLKQGMIETYIKPDAYSGDKLRIYLGIKSDHSISITVTLAFLGDIEQLQHVEWWTCYDYQNQPSTRVRVEYWNGDSWVEVSQNDYDPLIGTDNEVAIGFNQYLNYWSLWDNTKIYIPAS